MPGPGGLLAFGRLWEKAEETCDHCGKKLGIKSRAINNRVYCLRLWCRLRRFVCKVFHWNVAKDVVR